LVKTRIEGGNRRPVDTTWTERTGLKGLGRAPIGAGLSSKGMEKRPRTRAVHFSKREKR